ncbi:MAG: transcription-repair coupling factor [Candidatus Eremiobacter antarcticus]|nr:transcription-repair coupling factor [Candidatus Eremiobacteraeota bacterium]PZR60843.1 MAG: transcription-repair coupling factor [Candidatus Eremiobacter sp. RRmetagenome_bin22]
MLYELGAAIAAGIASGGEALKPVAQALGVKASVDIAEVAQSARAAAISALWRNLGGQFLTWHSTIEAADRFANDASFYLSAAGSPVHVLRPRDDGSSVLVNPTERSERLSTLHLLLSGRPGVYCLPHVTVRQALPDVKGARKAVRRYSVGKDYGWDDVLGALVDLGYERAEVVSAVGEFAVRGGLIDVFPATAEYPLRLEFFGDRLEQIRAFALTTQRSLGSHEAIEIGPWTETGAAGAGARIWDYAPDAPVFIDHADMIVAVDEGFARVRDDTTVASADASEADPDEIDAIETGEEPENRAEAEDSPGGDPGRAHIFDLPELSAALDARAVVSFVSSIHSARLARKADIAVALPCEPAPAFERSIEKFIEYVRERSARGATVCVASVGHRRIAEVLEEHDISRAPVGSRLHLPSEAGAVLCADGLIDAGFVIPGLHLVVLGDNELYGHPARRQKLKAAKEGVPLSESDLKPGEHFVHAHHGIGQYVGLEHLTINAVERDFMQLRYAGEDRLYVPIDQMHLVRKYVASDGAAPRLSKMGGSDWARTRGRVVEAVEKIAEGLVRLYAARELAVGHPFSPDTPWQSELEESFLYDETPDQHEAIAAVKSDMERPRPMDRLVCGDVGYGKTEVAIRAAFKAIMDRKQVALLAPTTVLAAQHFRTFSERFAAFPVKIALLSRFRSKAEQKETLRDLQAGSVDLVIGTHRLLQKDIGFKQLGLVIVDEEQRFGVIHKERLKEMRQSVDVLTLSATPIPRTLHMAMAGVREMSLIATAPVNRVAIKTIVAPSSDGLIASALAQELERGGQVYFVHNRIETIYGVTAAVQRLAPRARIAIGHGQMKEHELESVMLAFVNGEIDILVSTTIIENGLDIPNVNTIVVNNAAHFGLAQLYQLRGRVGRSTHQAYAYFLYQPHRALTEVARNRLEAIREFSHLGSGLQLAMRDLEIRGAGNLLGREQHGFITAVGFETYCNILQEAVAARRGQTLKQPEAPPVLDLHVSAYFPSEYMKGANQKISFYQRLAAAQSTDEVDRIGEELRDRFGPLPTQAQSLLDLTKVRVIAALKGVQKVSLERRRLTLDIGPKFSLSEQALPHLTSLTSGNFRFVQDGIVAELPSNGSGAAGLAAVSELISAL